MFVEGYHLSSLKWSYPDIYSIDYFLEDFKSGSVAKFSKKSILV